MENKIELNTPRAITIDYPLIRPNELDRFFELLDTRKELAGLSDIITKASKPLDKPNTYGYRYIQKITILKPLCLLDIMDVIIYDDIQEFSDDEQEDINYLTQVFLSIATITNRQLFYEAELTTDQVGFLYKNLLTLITIDTNSSVLSPIADYLRRCPLPTNPQNKEKTNK